MTDDEALRLLRLYGEVVRDKSDPIMEQSGGALYSFSMISTVSGSKSTTYVGAATGLLNFLESTMRHAVDSIEDT